jgi:hypothetical protein
VTTSSNSNSKPQGGEHQPRANWRANRRRNRALGLDRFGKPLPRVAGTNPRAVRERQLQDVAVDDRRLAEVQLGRKLGWVNE